MAIFNLFNKQKPLPFILNGRWYYVIVNLPGSRAIGPFNNEAEALAHWRREMKPEGLGLAWWVMVLAFLAVLALVIWVGA